jgi:hypothetical protein
VSALGVLFRSSLACLTLSSEDQQRACQRNARSLTPALIDDRVGGLHAADPSLDRPEAALSNS